MKTNERILEVNNVEFKVLFDDYNGYSMINMSTNNVYSLLEGRSLGASTTSDIVFIMQEIENDNECYSKFVNFSYGASFADEDDDLFIGCAKYILDYEKSFK